MIKRKGKFQRTFLVLASAFPTIADGARGVWKNKAGHKWMVPLIVFLCMTGLLLVLAGAVQALAPFVYAIF